MDIPMLNTEGSQVSYQVWTISREPQTVDFSVDSQCVLQLICGGVPELDGLVMS